MNILQVQELGLISLCKKNSTYDWHISLITYNAIKYYRKIFILLFVMCVMHSSLNEWNERSKTSILFEISQRNALTIIVLAQTIQLYIKWLRGYQLSSGKFIRFLFFFDMCATEGLNVGSYDKHLATCHFNFSRIYFFIRNMIPILSIYC